VTRQFSINYYDIVALEDVSDHIVSVEEAAANGMTKGTVIEINLRDPHLLIEYLSDAKNRDKVLNSFIDTGFNIKLEIDGQHFATKQNLALAAYYPGSQMFHVRFSSTDKKMRFTYGDHQRLNGATGTEEFDFEEGLSNQFALEIELMIFDFTSGNGRGGRDLDGVFIVSKKITPLIYINKNLFHNFDLFDPESLRYSQSGKSLPQMIGFV